MSAILDRLPPLATAAMCALGLPLDEVARHSRTGEAAGAATT